jgi:hypothetical protein
MEDSSLDEGWHDVEFSFADWIRTARKLLVVSRGAEGGALSIGWEKYSMELEV